MTRFRAGTALVILALTILAGTGIASLTRHEPSCTFGGGTITNATFATTSAGTTWVCSNGELIQVTIVHPPGT